MPNVSVIELGEVWKVEVSRACVGLQFRGGWGAQLYKAGPTGRWHKVGKMVISHKGPVEVISDLLRALELGLLSAR